MEEHLEKAAFLSKEKPLLLQGAMELEVATLRAQIRQCQTIWLGQFVFWQGKIGDQPVILAKTGIGTASAGASTALACERFQPAAIVNQGTAGGYGSQLHPYDLVVANTVYNANASFTSKEGNTLFLDLDKLEKESDESRFTSSEPFVQPVTGPVAGWLDEVSSTYTKGRVHKGLIASGDQWNEDPELVTGYEKFFHVACEEMEAAAAYGVARKFGIPFGAVRVISNNNRLGEAFVPETAAALQAWLVGLLENKGL